ncbi:MAG: hypothetical protein JW715_17005 [Sedimentisphaerales bacterium]|nr:hypothetical protein [Sedimentisphaerales bacterium]
MKISSRTLIFLIIYVFLIKCVQAEDANDVEINQDSAATIELTKLDVNDTTLELAWKIVNNTDHDVWICDVSSFYDVYLDPDAKTLILRRRFNLPCKYVTKGFIGRYVRLRSGQEKIESIFLDLPIKRSFVFQSLSANAELATRLALEIGFYDEDLPGSIFEIVDLAEELNCDIEPNSPIWDYTDTDICRRFFAGVFVARFFYLESFVYFRDSVTSGGDEILIPYMWQNLNGEQVLRAEIDCVSIPIKSINLPLENQDVNEPADSQDVEESAVSMELTHFEITDANLELAWKIKNNTDHDVWVCDSVKVDRPKYEVFLNADLRTLQIRRRLDVPPPSHTWRYGPPTGRYVRLLPGEDMTESLVRDLPVESTILYASRSAEVTTNAACIALEIGYYDEDLPALVRSIIQEAEKFSGTFNAHFTIMNDYFRGLVVKGTLGSLEDFDSFNKDPYNDGKVWIRYSSQALTGEKVLKINIDGVSIPYEGGVQSASQAGNE